MPSNIPPDATLVVLGNGPSLKGFDFAQLQDFDCIGMNAAYRYWHEIGWYPRFYACLDHIVGLSHREAIIDLIADSDGNGIELFLLRRNLIDGFPQSLKSSHKVVDFDDLTKRFPKEFSPLVTTGSHAALFGAHLGYTQLILLGIDCNYVEKVDGAKEAGGIVLELTETPSENPNYFFASYQMAGDRYNLPNPMPDMHVGSWRAAATLLRDRGVTTWNCSPISKVDAFPFGNFDDLADHHRERGERPRTLKIDRGRPSESELSSEEESPVPLEVNRGRLSGSSKEPALEGSSIPLTVNRGQPSESGEVPALEERPRLLEVSREQHAESGGTVRWAAQALWRRRLVLALAGLAILLPLALAFVVPIYWWLLAGLSSLLAIIALLMFGFLFARAVRRRDWLATKAYVQRTAKKQVSSALSAALSKVKKMESANLKAELKSLKERQAELKSLKERVGSLQLVGTSAQQLSITLTNRMNKLESMSPLSNYAFYQPFNRRLKPDHIRVIRNEWQDRLGITIGPNMLYYTAHRIAMLELNSYGRLATSIEDAVLRTLVVLSVRSSDLRILEIGTLFGLGLAAIYDRAQSRFTNVYLTAIDPLDGYYGKAVRDTHTDEPVCEEIFRDNLERAGIPTNNVTLIKALSTDKAAIDQAAEFQYDVLIIDGDHSYAGVEADFVNYGPLVSLGGYIIFDDYGTQEWPDVRAFVDTHVSSNPNLKLVGSAWRTAVFQVVRPLQKTAGKEKS